ncbi:MAG: flagellar biosynthesis regulator FlaF [Pseudomonadota bacterium]|nr:flagellar biosynthesis regulator FlaF [Pseudomonadota bacterium]
MSPSSDPYRTSQKLGAGARQTEARALMETARTLADAQNNMDDISAYRAALRLNWRLWTIFQSDVSSAENPLPDEIKQNILNLSVFIDKHTVDALANPEVRKLKVLIDINRNIASGLITSPEGGDDAPTAPAQSPSSSEGGVIA